MGALFPDDEELFEVLVTGSDLDEAPSDLRVAMSEVLETRLKLREMRWNRLGIVSDLREGLLEVLETLSDLLETMF